MPDRDYRTLATEISARLSPESSFEERMRAVADVVWEGLRDRGVSWCGFYLPDAGGGQLLLGPRRDRPACSPISLEGVCGRAFRERGPVVVRDVAELGAAYVCCDPRDRSEVVVPVLLPSGEPRAVLDLDSHEVGAFDEADVAGLRLLLDAAGI
jgi:putative methionine-R-sulfoxide reductase with GAF domain